MLITVSINVSRWVKLRRGTEDLQFDEKGALLSNNLANYKVPDIYFISDRILS